MSSEQLSSILTEHESPNSFQAEINGIMANVRRLESELVAQELRNLLDKKHFQGEVDCACDFDDTMVDGWSLREMILQSGRGMIVETIRDTAGFNLRWTTVKQMTKKAVGLTEDVFRMAIAHNPRVIFNLLTGRLQADIEGYVQDIAARTHWQESCLEKIKNQKIIIISRNYGELIKEIVRQQGEKLAERGIQVMAILGNDLEFNSTGRCLGVKEPIIDTAFKGEILPPGLLYCVDEEERKILGGLGLAVI